MRRRFPSRLAESFFLRHACAVALAVFLAPGAARAVEWIGVTSDWFNAFAWSFPGGVPGPTDTVFLDDSFQGIPLLVTNVALSTGTTIEQLSVDSPAGK